MGTEELDEIGTFVRPILDARFRARETAITQGRLVVRASANAIRALHRDESDIADELIAEAGSILAGIGKALEDHPEMLHAGFVSDAAKEYAEARLTAAMLRGDPFPSAEDLGMDPVPYLHGLGETVGECRRRLLDLLRADELDEAERMLQAMDGIVDLLATIDYPDGMTSGLRRTTDVARSLVERSRADLTSTAVQERLRRQLAGE